MSDTASWYITFGLDTWHRGTYTQVAVPAHLPRDEQSDVVRSVALDSYGHEWAFHYPPERFNSAILRYGMTRREYIEVSEGQAQLLLESLRREA